MSSTRALVVLSLLLITGRLVAQAAPTLPSDTLQANYAPRSVPAPHPELSPTLPSDTLQTADSSATADSLWHQKADTTALRGGPKDEQVPPGEIWEGRSPAGREPRTGSGAQPPEVNDPRYRARVSAKLS